MKPASGSKHCSRDPSIKTLRERDLSIRAYIRLWLLCVCVCVRGVRVRGGSGKDRSLESYPTLSECMDPVSRAPLGILCAIKCHPGFWI